MTSNKNEKILAIVERGGNSRVEEILYTYMNMYPKEFSATRINDIIRRLQDQYLPMAISQLETSREISLERALYLEAFLEGKLYTSEEAARKHVPLQLENARAIIRACKEVRNGSET